MSLKITGLDVIYPGKSHSIRALEDIDLEMRPGHCTAMIGESGSGKSTLAYACLGLLPPSTRIFGDITFNGQPIGHDHEETSNQFRWKKVALAFQNGSANLNPVHRVIDQVVEPLLIHTDLDKAEAMELGGRSLGKLGLSPEQQLLFPHQLSGGQLQRVMLAMALILDPEVIILDEPTACLDAVTKIMVANLIEQAKAQNKAILLITHDLEFAVQTSDSITVLYAGQVMEKLPAAHLLSAPMHPYTMALVRSYPATNTARDLGGIRGDFTGRVIHHHTEEFDRRIHRHFSEHPGDNVPADTNHHPSTGCLFQPRCTQALCACEAEQIELRPHLEHQVRCLRNGIADILELRGITKSYDNNIALHSTDLTIKAGEVFSLVGESGSGKSTLAMIGSGMLTMDEGCRIFKDEDMDEWIRRDYKSLAGHIGLIFQNQSAAINHRFTIFEAVAEPLRIHKVCKNEEELTARVKEVLRDVHLPTDDALLKRYPHQLNQGSLQRVGIARALALGPSLLIADEPTSSLDPSVQAKVVKLLLDLQTERGLAMLFITHDIGLARKISDRLGVMSHGRLVEIGPASLVFDQPAHPYTKFLIDSAAGRAPTIRTEPMETFDKQQGCFFADLCPHQEELCLRTVPPVREEGQRLTACHLPVGG